MIRYPLLDVCARIDGHNTQHNMLREYCRDFSDWENMVACAEREGMAPLLRKHLEEAGCDYPSGVRMTLKVLENRHRHCARMRIEVLQEVLTLMRQHSLSPIVIKGAALCFTLYPDPALRPMRDIDILFRKEEVDDAQQLLREMGFASSGSPVPPDHYHLPPLHKTVGEMKVCFELHRGLYPNCPPYYPDVDFDRLYRSAKKITVGDVGAVTFGDEEMLNYLFLHGVRSPISYENFKLINIADVVGFVEKNCRSLDWDGIGKRYPLLYKSLPTMHHITPWNHDNVPKEFVALTGEKKRLEPKPFVGWPQRKLKELRKTATVAEILKETFVPSSWWVRAYYGVSSKTEMLAARFFHHPRHVFWWVRLYSGFLDKSPGAGEAGTKRVLGRLMNIRILAVMQKLFGRAAR
ncbi:nucleotidyltransferase domain-containing protein [Desulforhopalus singaporensis]|uniref:Uncharacterized nucleotidyltransferase n=1 Tax=Desulforhopalus singaporensis TaxID=91360 RepID=A0A1H0SGE4_9BACT|nr:nucleotidyltransferase family protein [Desulforhopalus singaporensis]SDP40328.1 Uncharacterised nucleotidyltransferase [Desulforhopalus singaporensis]